MAVVLVDGENVRRSQWPNVPKERLVELVRHWADDAGHDAVVVFDGAAPVERDDVVGTGGETADDWLVRRAQELHTAGGSFWLVTSDRGLRARVGTRAERTIGGGSFLRELLALPRA